jgi:hypothetical protein
MTLFSAVSRYRISTCDPKQFFDKSFCAPHFLPNLPEVCPFSPRVRDQQGDSRQAEREVSGWNALREEELLEAPSISLPLL